MREKINLNQVEELPKKIYNRDLKNIASKINNANLAIQKINNSWLSDADKKTARKKHEETLASYAKNLDQLKTVSGIVSLFDRENYLKVQESAKPNGRPVIVLDMNKCHYLCAHGSEVKTVVDGKEVLSHQIDDDMGKSVDTNEYIIKCIKNGKIAPNSTLRVTSCHVSALDILKEYPNGVKVEKITSDSGEVFDDHVTQNANVETNVAIIGSDKLMAA